MTNIQRLPMNTVIVDFTIHIENASLDEAELEDLTRKVYYKLQKLGVKRVPLPEKLGEKGGSWLTGVLKIPEIDKEELIAVKATIEDIWPDYQIKEFYDKNGNKTMLQILPRQQIQEQRQG
jgi:hypothetical protein